MLLTNKALAKSASLNMIISLFDVIPIVWLLVSFDNDTLLLPLANELF